MPAWAVRDGKRVPLSPGDAVTTAQEVETAAGAALVMRLPEGSLVRLGEKTRLGVQRLEVSGADGRTAVRSGLKLFDGFFRFATTAVAKVAGQREIEVSLRTATIGIRGTDFWAMTDDAHDAACLFEGKVDLATRDQGALTLDKPTAFWARFFAQPVQPVGNATPDELAKFLQSTELLPGQGVAVVGGRWRVVAAAVGSDAAAQALAARLALGFRGDGTGIEDDGVAEARRTGMAADHFAFKRIEATAEGDELRLAGNSGLLDRRHGLFRHGCCQERRRRGGRGQSVPRRTKSRDRSCGHGRSPAIRW